MSEHLPQVFTFKNAPVRVVMHGENPWFVAADVCAALGYSNPSDAIAKHCKGAEILTSQNAMFEVPNRGLTIIPESDLYRLIMRSKMDEAEAFQDWVTGEVLPSIRKHGIYATPTTIESMIADPDFAIGLLQKLKCEREQRALAEIQRDRAIATKSQIGARREASAMATASAAVRRAAVLEEQLGISEEWKAVKSIEWLKDAFDFSASKALYSLIGKALRKKSEAMRFQVREIPSQEYGHILTFHRDVISAFLDDLNADPSFMAKYRKVQPVLAGVIGEMIQESR